jgi:hypothetical protein
MQKMWHGIPVDSDLTDRRLAKYKDLVKWFAMKRESLEEIMFRWKGWLDELKIPFILNQSIVLGLYREKKLFESERVMEFAVLGEDLTEEKLNELKTNKKYQFQYESTHEAPIGLLYFRDLELQPIYFKNGKGVYNLLGNQCLVYSEDLLKKENWASLPYKGIDWPTPRNIPEFLTQAYGGWTVPNKSYNWQEHANNKMLWEKI